MDPLVIVSPHLDDAVLSCGQLMAGRPDCVVITLFAGVPANHRRVTSYDVNCGFSSAAHAQHERWVEDDAALARLAARPVRFDFTDDQYGEGCDEHALAQTLIGAIRAIGPAEMIGPLGLAHPDHHRARRAYQQAVRALPMVTPWVYEDMPSRVLWPEMVPEAFAWWAGMGWDAEQHFAGTGPRDVKEAAIGCYRSQLWALDPPTLLVPERHWRLTWNG